MGAAGAVKSSAAAQSGIGMDRGLIAVLGTIILSTGVSYLGLAVFGFSLALAVGLGILVGFVFGLSLLWSDYWRRG